MAARYKQLMALCRQWPLDTAKEGRDLGVFIREQVAAAFKHGESTVVADETYCREAYASLGRINSNHHKILYPLPKTRGCTGLTLEECGMMTATEGLKSLNEE